MIIGLGLVLYIVGVKGWLSLYLLIMIIPLVGRYLKMLSGIMGRIGINESLKKVLVIILIIVIGGFVNEVIYVLVFMVFNNGILRTVVIGVYVFLLVGVSM